MLKSEISKSRRIIPLYLRSKDGIQQKRRISMLKQFLNQKLSQKLSPQQIQLMKLLQLPTVELEQRIKDEIEENPALEEGLKEVEDEISQDEGEMEPNDESREDFDLSEYMSDDDIPDYKTSTNNYSVEDDETHIPFAAGMSFQESLRVQVGLKKLNDHEMILADVIIGNLDEAGYLRRELDKIVNDLAFGQNIEATVEELEGVLLVVQNLDPAGIGARDLKECLVLQLNRKPDYHSIKIAKELLKNHFDSFTKRHYEKILGKMDIDKDLLKEAIEEIVKLNPKPGNSIKETNRSFQQIIPDFILNVEDDELTLSLNKRNAPQLRVSREYSELLKGYDVGDKTNKEQKKAVLFAKQKIDGAKWFIDAIKQRQNTLLITMQAILVYQRNYFLSGDEAKLRPMILKDIAEKIDMDISTVSRVANSKYVQTPYGTLLLKYFFSESLTTDTGEEVSTREVKKILQDCIDSEEKSKPLTDARLTEILKEKGYNIARRTVAKYREQLNIPVARLRKEL
ncbi:MAG: RNA polymerase sigma-54 factor [Patiriisocius sp.]|jgi:RNA polymerase sigma-54 factor